jgi:putative phosphoribosyl transferase
MFNQPSVLSALVLELQDDITLAGEVAIPESATGIIILTQLSSNFLHNEDITDFLNQNNLGTITIDLLTREEFKDLDKRYDIDLLTERLGKIWNWTKQQYPLLSKNIALLGSGKGAAVALKFAAENPGKVKTVVSRSGRPDLVEKVLPKVKCPVLLVVGKLDPEIEEYNHQAVRKMVTKVKLVSVRGASHLFCEYGKRNELVLEILDWLEDMYIDKEEKMLVN